MREFFEKSWQLLLTVAVVWLFAVLFYFLSGATNPENTERRVDAIVHHLDAVYSKSGTVDDRRHVVMATLLQEQSNTLWEGIFLHLAIAFFVAGMLIVGVDGVTRYRTQREFREQAEKTREEFKQQTEEVSRHVWNAIFHRFVPSEVALQVENILKSRVCRFQPHYFIKFPRTAYQGVPQDYLIVRREVHYRMQNLSGEGTDWPFLLSIVRQNEDQTLKDDQGQDVTLPLIKSVSIDGTPIKIGDRMEINETVRLKPNGSKGDAVEVISIVDELLGVTDQATYVLTTPAVGFDVTILNEIPDTIEVQNVYLTGGRDKLHQTLPEHWTYDGALLAGIALVVSWQKKKTGATPVARTTGTAPCRQPRTGARNSRERGTVVNLQPSNVPFIGFPLKRSDYTPANPMITAKHLRGQYNRTSVQSLILYA